MKQNKHVQSGFLLASLGMIYGDIGISPLYVLKYIVQECEDARNISEPLVLGSVSLILWSLLLLTTVKGVLLLLRADNQGEGGHLALYALVREYGRWLLIPAALGAAALLADSVLTPALSLTAATEGGRTVAPALYTWLNSRKVVFLVIALLSVLFFFQSFGSRSTGRLLGPIMLAWFLFIGIAGAVQLSHVPSVLRAFDPRFGIRILFSSGNPLGFSLLGLVFLAVTGTEILYANLDFGGRKSITQVWPFVLLCLFLSYLGQGAWLLKHPDIAMGTADPFFQMLPAASRLPAVLLALAAAWAASQTVINGTFTLVSEAVRLDLLPPLEIRYPSDSIMQEYIPAVNTQMWVFSCAAVVVFQSGQQMASVYGMTIAISMLMTTMMLFMFMRAKSPGAWPLHLLLILFGIMEAVFLTASLEKLLTGGMITLLLTLFLLAAMLSWNRAEEIERRFSKKLPICDFIPQLDNLRSDTDIVKLTDNLVYLDREEIPETIDQAILYSILDRGPKRAQAYWFIRIRTVGEPYVERYQVETFGTDCVFRVELDLGFKCSRPLTWYLREVFLDMERQGLTSIHRKNHFVSEESELGTFRYCILRRYATGIEQLSTTELWALRIRHILEGLAGLREEWYTDKDTNVEVERIPLSLSEESSGIRIQRVFRNGEEQTLHTEE